MLPSSQQVEAAQRSPGPLRSAPPADRPLRTSDLAKSKQTKQLRVPRSSGGDPPGLSPLATVLVRVKGRCRLLTKTIVVCLACSPRSSGPELARHSGAGLGAQFTHWMPRRYEGLGLVIRTQDHDCDIRLPRLSLISLIQPSTCYN